MISAARLPPWSSPNFLMTREDEGGRPVALLECVDCAAAHASHVGHEPSCTPMSPGPSVTRYTGVSGPRPSTRDPRPSLTCFPFGAAEDRPPTRRNRIRGDNVTTFRDLGLRAEIVDALAAQGIDEPFPIQAATIDDALAGRDVCGKAKTGSGKTLAFGLPALQTVEAAQPGPPDRARARADARARQAGRRRAEPDRQADRRARRRVLRRHVDGPPDPQPARASIEIAVATPGRLIDLLERGELDLDADRDPRHRRGRPHGRHGIPAAGRVDHAQGPDDRQTLLFSATLDREVDVLVRRYMRDPVLHEVVSETQTVDEMLHRFLKVHELDRVKVLAAIAAGVDARWCSSAPSAAPTSSSRSSSAKACTRPRSTATCASRRARRR